MNIRTVVSNSPYTFTWPNGREEYERCDEILVSTTAGAPARRLFVAYGYREAYGRNRRRIVVFQNQGYVLAEFVGTDRWEHTHEVATFLRRDRSKQTLRPGDSVPAAYLSLALKDAKAVLSGPWLRTGVVAVVKESDLNGLVEVALAREQAKWPPPDLPLAATKPAVTKVSPIARAPADARPEAVVQALLAFLSQFGTGGSITKNAEADALLRQNPFAFVMAACLDRGAHFEVIWQVPFYLCRELGHLDPVRLARMTEADLESSLRSLSKMPRFPRYAARTIIALSSLVVRQGGGDASRIWRSMPVREVNAAFDGIWGVGPGIAHMAVRLLIDELGYRPAPEELREIDVKADTHVMRVFYRSGLAPEQSPTACVEAARRWHAEYPALLDWPAWEVGRSYCRPSNPKCGTCPLDAGCAKTSIEHGG